VLVLLFAAAAPPPLRAQASPPGGGRPRLDLAVGLHVGAPQKVSLAVGAARSRAMTDGGAMVFGLVEPGLGAGRASVGYLRMYGNLGAGLGARASVLRTWRDPWSVAPHRTFAGVEGSAHLFFFNVRGGVFRRTTAAAGGAFLFTLDAGLLL
jgi:hypothetical protein